MANIHDIETLIHIAEIKVIQSDYEGARVRYELAERLLDEELIFTFGLTRITISLSPDLQKVYQPYYDKIIAGYNNINSLTKPTNL